MKRMTALILVLCLILCACGGSGSEETTQVTTEAATECLTEPTDPPEVTTEPTEPPAAALPNTINPLTGEVLEEESNARPYAIMINNSSKALPQTGIGEADIIYETLVEGGITRMMAIFMDPASAGAIGPVRSTREVFVGIMEGYDAIHSSAGGSTVGIQMLNDVAWDYINGLNYNAFYRDQERLAKVALEHTMFVKGESLVEIANNRGFRTERREDMDYGLSFDDSVSIEGDSASTITIKFQTNGKTTVCNYDAEQGNYTLYQQGQDFIDGTTNELVRFRNVLILEAESYLKSDNEHTYVETVGSGVGYYARDGKVIPIRWSKESLTAPYTYTLEDGTPLSLGIGTSYIAIVADGAPVIYE